MRAERNVWDTTKMAGLVGNQKEFVDRLTYQMYFSIDSDDQFRAQSGAWTLAGSYTNVWRSTNGSTVVTWAVRKPEDWIRGETHAYVWWQGERNGIAYRADANLHVNVRLAEIGEDFATDGNHIELVNSNDTFNINTTTEDELLRYKMATVIQDVSHGNDGLLLVRLRRVASVSDDYMYFFGVELVHYPTLER